ncbi:hypothetical protein F4778DRAFT_561175 [Xylariomycetidae sp. FL2044]|nr:hypothetical protein F4778DRAFT_561175 [Xylariomycetidae sp. FL2044]
MDDTTRLAAELLQKLGELDHKICEYRQNMVQEFERYSQNLLQQVPDNVSTQVEKVIAVEMQNYPALKPAFDRASGSHATSAVHTSRPGPEKRDSRCSPPPVLPHTSGPPPEDGTRSPHAREQEFHGLFTPSYLPLLDAVQRHKFEPTTMPSPPPVPETMSEVDEPNTSQDILPPSLENVIPSRPSHVRRCTEETISSTTSDDSTSRARRSALRRSSSSSVKTQSPRRVRFEVEGQEVLPTASPDLSPRILDRLPSPIGSSTGFPDEPASAVGLSEESSLLTNSPPKPRKITSTDRLKAMARNSTEDTSQWTVVGDVRGLDEDEEDELVMGKPNGSKRDVSLQASVTDYPELENVAHRTNDARLPTQMAVPLEVVQELEEDETAEEDDSDDALMMPALSSFKGRKRFSPPEQTTPVASSHTARPSNTQADAKSASRPSGGTKVGPSEEVELFEFEYAGGEDLDEARADTRPSTKYIDNEAEEEEEDDEEDWTPVAEDSAQDSKPILFSTSPAMPIPKPGTPPTASSLSRHTAASAGSYKGKPFVLSSVRENGDVYKRAAQMGEFYSFVGSVDGRSGVDESRSSFRPDVSSFNGTPRSLSERQMKDELEESQFAADSQG